MRSAVAALILLAASGTVARSDVSVWYTMNIEPGPALAPPAAAQIKTQMKDMADASELMIEGRQARSSGMGSTASITGFDGPAHHPVR